MQSKAQTVDAYLDELPPDRRETLGLLRALILKVVPEVQETMLAARGASVSSDLINS